MFKLIVLSVFVALAAAKPGFLHEPLVHAAPIVEAPLITKTIVQPAPLLVRSEEHIGSVISSIPTGVSAHSSSVVHSAAPVVSSVVTPIQKTIVAHAPIVSEPLVRYASAPAPILKTVHSPAFYSQPLLQAPLLQAPLLQAPLLKTYAAAPSFAYSHAPLAYNAPVW